MYNQAIRDHIYKKYIGKTYFLFLYSKIKPLTKLFNISMLSIGNTSSHFIVSTRNRYIDIRDTTEKSILFNCCPKTDCSQKAQLRWLKYYVILLPIRKEKIEENHSFE